MHHNIIKNKKRQVKYLPNNFLSPFFADNPTLMITAGPGGAFGGAPPGGVPGYGGPQMGAPGMPGAGMPGMPGQMPPGAGYGFGM